MASGCSKCSRHLHVPPGEATVRLQGKSTDSGSDGCGRRRPGVLGCADLVWPQSSVLCCTLLYLLFPFPFLQFQAALSPGRQL